MKRADGLYIINSIGVLPFLCIRVSSIMYFQIVRKHFHCEFTFELKSNSEKRNPLNLPSPPNWEKMWNRKKKCCIHVTHFVKCSHLFPVFPVLCGYYCKIVESSRIRCHSKLRKAKILNMNIL